MQLGALVSNDIALSRHARNVGVLWLRTADLVLLTVHVAAIDARQWQDALDAYRAGS